MYFQQKKGDNIKGVFNQQSKKMPILFALVSRGTTVLAKYANCAGNFNEVVDQVLAKITPENNKMTYTHGSYLFHYISERRIIYLCITDDDFVRAKAFSFLADIKRRFEVQFGDRALTALPYSMNSDFSRTMALQMTHFNSNTADDPDKIQQVNDQVEELKGIMVRNIDQITSRGEQLELLIDKTEDLSANSVSFKKTSTGLARSMRWKNIKLTLVIVVIGIIVLYFIVSIACGGLGWQKCVKKK